MNHILIYTDGSSRGNPGPGGFAAICMYPDSHGVIKVSELGGGDRNTTNNRMELTGAIKALEFLQDYFNADDAMDIHIYSDSSYVLQGISAWVFGWKKNGWMTSTKEAVKNEDLWRALDTAVAYFTDKKIKVIWHKVKGHAGIINNERCDEIATAFADEIAINLFDGNLSSYTAGEYHAPIDHIQKNENGSSSDSQTKNKSSSSSKQKAFSYVSLVDGEIYIDVNWAACEKRVKRKSGVRFKKSFSKSDEEKIIKEFLK